MTFGTSFMQLPELSLRDQVRRYEWTLQNALWAREHHNHSSMRLYASLQAMCPETAREAARIFRNNNKGFDGIGVGGLVPRLRDRAALVSILEPVLKEANGVPVHAFGLGTPDLVGLLRDLGWPAGTAAPTCSGLRSVRTGRVAGCSAA
ncbi:hypothetical protein [Deinococcus cellulosilyticus]|uniref:Uncharacterized protein n=1 Tax=Deinococcus cellulosilyticus (strain DSM 18568 / NBRC 106333 / KACC 11606 / 5516J-15) TaxID=1223518 RepID=A0A511NBF4_DEIC1|nr:hypothetical protein [Deinococcus cellulosilyticus]GEM50113.1 hypothetical protein DC3_57480 [Deinococcus cellulosilyticus NBRC 106333 = KACC 11606]